MSSAGMSQDMTQLFQMMKTEFDQQTAIVTKSVNETIMHIIDEKLHLFLEENKYLKNEVQRLKEKVKYLDEQNRKNNLLLHGIKETEKNHQELFNLIKQTLKNLDIEIDIYEINNFYRLGKKQGDSKVRPILISLTSFQKKLIILENKMKMPKQTYITEDFSKETLEMRKDLQEKLKQVKQSGKDAFIRNNKIVIKETIDTGKRKREASISPDNIKNKSLPSGSKNIIAPPKLQKTNLSEYMRVRSSSLTEKPSQQNNA
ncbi:unnamed protein product [Euphydryas editha]|uniref:Endonuclease-reverse transcriptase n=1 Tax=Euphydryas editha TaxID=104508 RepID=A0AAU9TWH6_EUPED|nr:unnamed protein product [Euphydryas editha]